MGRKVVFTLIVGSLLVLILGLPVQAVDYPAPIFTKPPDNNTNVPGAIAPETYTNKPNIFECAQNTLSEKFPFDILAGSTPNNNQKQCPSLSFFAGTPGEVNMQFCVLLDIISMMKFPIIIGFLVHSIINL